jgi:sec-independent protein translocase protein TatB
MFDFSWSELLLIGIVALVVIGPKELPGVLRTLGQWMSKVRRMAGEFQNQFHDAMREAELADLKREVDEMKAQASKYANFDPLTDVRKDMEAAEREIESAVAGTPAEQLPSDDAALAAPAAAEPASTEPVSTEPVSTEPVSTEPASAGTAALPQAPGPSSEAPAKASVETPVKHSVVGSESA